MRPGRVGRAEAWCSAPSSTTMRMAASVGWRRGPLSVPRKRPQLAGQSPLLALKPACPGLDQARRPPSCTAGSLPSRPARRRRRCRPRRPRSMSAAAEAGLAEIGGERRADGGRGTVIWPSSTKIAAWVPINLCRLVANGDSGTAGLRQPAASLRGFSATGSFTGPRARGRASLTSSKSARRRRTSRTNGARAVSAGPRSHAAPGSPPGCFAGGLLQRQARSRALLCFLCQRAVAWSRASDLTLELAVRSRLRDGLLERAAACSRAAPRPSAHAAPGFQPLSIERRRHSEWRRCSGTTGRSTPSAATARRRRGSQSWLCP